MKYYKDPSNSQVKFVLNELFSSFSAANIPLNTKRGTLLLLLLSRFSRV